MTATAWNALDAELNLWAKLELKPSLWLRDDDAIEPTPALDQLLGLCTKTRVPLALAVIPAGATAELAQRLQHLDRVSVLQHGFAHANHALGGEKKSEFAELRPLEAMTGELVQGRATLTRLFGDAALPVLAPPWNRIAKNLLEHLPAAGLAGLTRFKPRKAASPVPGIREVNTHVDLIQWREGRTGAPLIDILARITAHLTARRTGSADQAETTGILTHHLAMDATAWATLAALLHRLGPDNRVVWPPVPQIFELPT